MSGPVEKEVLLVIVRPEPVRDHMRRDDQQALEEIRRLFARYREAARHGQVKERDDSPEARPDEPRRAEGVPRR
jgi:hypothetical protein